MTNGWSRPLGIEVSVRLPELGSAMQAGFDVSGLKSRRGRLRAELGKVSTYKVVRSGRTDRQVRMNVDLPYAEALNNGADIPERTPQRAEYMHYHAYGKEWFRKIVKGFRLNAYQYVERGWEVFAGRFNITETFDIGWAQ